MLTKILIIDHNDSFTFNLVQLLEEIENIVVFVQQADNLKDLNVEIFDGIILSPGPALPKNYPQIKDFLKDYHLTKPLLGICLGFQHIIEFFGGKLFNQEKVMHGKQIILQFSEALFLFKNITKPLKVGLYHSWAAVKKDIPKCLEITSQSEKNIVTSVQHKKLPITAVQFHPESYMTNQGKRMIQNWIENFKK